MIDRTAGRPADMNGRVLKMTRSDVIGNSTISDTSNSGSFGGNPPNSSTNFLRSDVSMFQQVCGQKACTELTDLYKFPAYPLDETLGMVLFAAA